MATPQVTPEPLLRFCDTLRELKLAAGSPSLGDLTRRMPGRPSVGTLSPLLAGKIRRPPRWELVRDLVAACREHALSAGIDLPGELGSTEVWRRRHGDLVRALADGAARRSPDVLGRLLRTAPDDRPPCLGDLTDSDLGVSRPLPGADAGYLARVDFDEEMRNMLSLGGPPHPYVLAYGEPGAGKTRSAVEALRAEFPADTDVLIPRDGVPLSELRSLADSSDRLSRPAVLWLDDLTAADLEHLTLDLLEWLSRWAVIAGTVPAHLCGEILDGTASGAGPAARAALRRACLVHLPLELSEAERAEAAWHFDDGTVPDSFAAAADVPDAREMLLRLNTARSAHPVGVCLVRAAIDCRRAGLERGVTHAELRRLLPPYLVSLGEPPADDVRFARGLAWAQDPVVRGRALLQPLGDTAGEPRWTAAPELVGEADSGPVPPFLWLEVIDLATPEECLSVGRQAGRRDALVYAVAAFTKAEERGAHHSSALLGLGQAKSLLGSHEAAKDAFRGVIGTGEPEEVARAAWLLGGLLKQEGDTAGAEEAWRLAVVHADDRQAPPALHALGLMLVDRGDMTEETEAVFRTAAESGHTEVAPRAWLMVATLRDHRGDPEGALAACERAAEWDHPDVMPLVGLLVAELRARLAGLAEVRGAGPGEGEGAEDPLERAGRLKELGDRTGALAAFRDAARSEDPQVRAEALLGAAWILRSEGRADEARAAFEETARCGVPGHAVEALLEAGVVLDEQGDPAGAHDAWTRAMETGVAGDAERAALNLGLLELRSGNHDAAERAFLRAVGARAPRIRAKAALNLAALGADVGAHDDVVDDWYRVAIETEDPEFMPQAALGLGGRMVGRGMRAEPRRLLERTIAAGDPELEVRGTLLLGMLHDLDGALDDAVTLYREVIERDHADYSVEAHLRLGQLCLNTGRVDAARWHLRTALDAGHPDHSPDAGMLLGTIHHEYGELDAAELLYRQVMETRKPKAASGAADLLAGILEHRGRPDEARSVWEWLVELGEEPHARRAGARLGAPVESGRQARAPQRSGPNTS